MAIAMTIQKYLKDLHIPFDVLAHVRTASSVQTALAAEVPPHRVAKAVVLEDELGYLMVVLPADRHVQMGVLRDRLGRKVNLASERALMRMFGDCALGAIPALGQAYGVETIIDDEIMEQPEIFIEGGSHEELIQLSRHHFMQLFQNAPHMHFASVH